MRIHSWLTFKREFMAIPKSFLEELEKKRAAARAGGGADKL
jgi:hypothetical protein